MEPFLISRWRCFPSFATFATPEVVAEIVDVTTLDGCKDMMFEARAMFEVVEEVLDTKMLDIEEQKLDVGPQGARGVTINFNTWSSFVSGVNVLGVLTKCVDQCNDAASRIKMAVIDLRRKDNIVDGCHDIASRMRMTVIDVSRITVIDNEIWLGMLTRGVDGCNDIADRMIVIDNGVDGSMDVSSISSSMTVIDDVLWLKYGLCRCLTAGISFQECTNQSVDGCKAFQDPINMTVDFNDILSKMAVIEPFQDPNA